MDPTIWRRWAAGLFLGMIALNLAVGALAYRYLGTIDANYSRLLNEGIPFLNNMQSVTAQASRAYALMVDLTQAESAAEAAQLETELAAVRAVSEGIYASPVNEIAVPAKLKAAYADIRQSRKDGKARLDQFLELVRQRKRTEATAYLHREIYPAHKAYLARLDRFCDDYETTFAALNRQLIEEDTHSRSLLFGLAVAPAALLFGLVGLLVTGVIFLLIAALTPRFRSSGSNGTAV